MLLRSLLNLAFLVVLPGALAAHPLRQDRYECRFIGITSCFQGVACTINNRANAHGTLDLKISSFTFCNGPKCETTPITYWQRWFSSKPPPMSDPLPNILQFQAEKPVQMNGVIRYADNTISLTYGDLLLSGKCE